MTEEYTEAVSDEAMQLIRVEVCSRVSVALEDRGLKLSLAGAAVAGGPTKAADPEVKKLLEQTLGLGCVAQVAGELGSAAVELLRAEKRYPAWALLRQIVECEYLCWAFNEDELEAAHWLTSTRDVRRRMWQPAHIRKRSAGRFRAKDYAVHCEWGGHPTPYAFSMTGPFGPGLDINLMWLDLSSHLVRVWRYAVTATAPLMEVFMDRKPGPSGVSTEISRLCDEWERSDRLLQIFSDLPDFPEPQ